MLHTWATNVDDPTVQPRWGKVGKQKIEDAGELCPKRMETVDDEILANALKFLDKARQDNKPFFLWLNHTRMHVVTHLSERALRAALIALRKSIADDGLLVVTIRPVEYWARSGRTEDEAGRLATIHERDGFAFDPHNREAIEGDVTYGDTSMTLGWLDAAAADCDWRLAGLDRSLGDSLQIIVYLRPGGAH